MLFIYNIIVQIANLLLKIIAFFSPKMKLFVDGRKPVFEILATKIKAEDKTIWFHAASLGEYEQGLPVIEKITRVSTFATPSIWDIETDRGPTRIRLKGEEDIRRIAGNTLLIADSNGLQFLIKDSTQLDKVSKKLLDRFR